MHTTGRVVGIALLIALCTAARAHGDAAAPAALAAPAQTNTWSQPAPLAAFTVPPDAPAAGIAPPDAAPAGPLTDVRQWQFRYRGRGVKADGIVTTLAQPLPDGTFQIIMIVGKRNRSPILALQPPGELVTSRGQLFSDNRLELNSPYLNQGGFSYQIGGGRYFNVCYAGPDEGCGEEGYQEFNYRSGGRPVTFEMTPLPGTTKMALSHLNPQLLAPLEESKPSGATPCDAEPESPSVLTTALSWLGFGVAKPPAASDDLTCRPAILSIKAP